MNDGLFRGETGRRAWRSCALCGKTWADTAGVFLVGYEVGLPDLEICPVCFKRGPAACGAALQAHGDRLLARAVQDGLSFQGLGAAVATLTPAAWGTWEERAGAVATDGK